MATNDFAPCVPVSARPLPECYEDNCICPWGHNYDRSKEICVPRPGYKHETMGPSGVHCTIRFAVANLVCLIIHILHELHASRAYNTHYYKFYSSIFFDRAHFENRLTVLSVAIRNVQVQKYRKDGGIFPSEIKNTTVNLFYIWHVFSKKRKGVSVIFLFPKRYRDDRRNRNRTMRVGSIIVIAHACV